MRDEDDEPLDEIEELTDDADLDEGEGSEQEERREQGGDDDRAKTEAEAREHGWKPKADWRGNQAGWVDADEFLNRLKPVSLRSTLDKTSKELADLKREREAEKRDFEDRFARLDKMNSKALARQREQLLGQIKAAQRQAAEAGDVEAFDHYAEQEARATQHFAKENEEIEKAAPKKAPQQQDAPDPAIAGWVDKNPAIRFNPAKWQAAVAFFSEAEADDPDGTIEDHLAHVETRLNETWPGTVRGGKARQNGNGRTNGQHKDDDDKRQRAPQTERSGRIASRSSSQAKGWAQIPNEERGILKRHIKEGLYKDEAEAAKQYWS